MIVLGDSAGNPGDILSAIRRTGMKAELWTGDDTRSSLKDTDAHFLRKHGRVLMTGISGAFTVAGFVHHVISTGSLQSALGSEGLGTGHVLPLIIRFYYLIAIVAGGWYVAPKAILSLRRFKPDMNLLMTIAVIGAVIIGEWLEAASVAFLFALSLTLESWSIGRARRAVEALLDLAPQTVRLLVNGRSNKRQLTRLKRARGFW
jgi:Zn2+/Cd2+-exporting ATPase